MECWILGIYLDLKSMNKETLLKCDINLLHASLVCTFYCQAAQIENISKYQQLIGYVIIHSKSLVRSVADNFKEADFFPPSPYEWLCPLCKQAV